MSTGHHSWIWAKNGPLRRDLENTNHFSSPLTMREVRYNSWNSPYSRYASNWISLCSAAKGGASRASTLWKVQKETSQKVSRVQFEVCFCIFYSRCILGCFHALPFKIASEVCFSAQCMNSSHFLRFYVQRWKFDQNEAIFIKTRSNG